ncbi:MAG: sigma-54-dependent Fis family transcriptional regulator [Bdellovibrionales bacterium]|nr:sigma-54-dependent Fis family transcriptional regulator [Bdellovibrionales bacterium]
MNSVLLITGQDTCLIDAKQLVVIGGAQSTGRKFSSLKTKGDYAVLSPSADGTWQAHVLIGKKRGLQKLSAGTVLEVEDLKLALVPTTSTADSSAADGASLKQFLELTRSLAEMKELTPALSRVLDLFQSVFGFEKGLIIIKDGSGFTPLVSLGLKVNDPWLSESLVQDTLKSSTPISISNIVGSRYDNSKSLVASGFYAVSSWPLTLRGTTFGALVAGSLKPHSGLSESELAQAEILATLSALMVERHLRETSLKEQVQSLISVSRDQRNDGPFLSHNAKMQEAIGLARDVSGSDLSLLINGETGVGKEVMAKWVHELSPRAQGPFIAVNCAAIPRDLLESVLFGHKRGAFTGATSDQIGKFQAAHGGTLFLDEVADLPTGLQAKILRAVQERSIEPLGSNKSLRVDVRFIAATHKNLRQMVRTGEFREDLYFRLAEITLEIPALRDRRDDIPVISAQILRELGAEDKKLSQPAWQWLKSQTWAGNVRELRSTLKRVILLSRGNEIELSDFKRGLPDDELRPAKSDLELWLGGETLEEARDRFTMEKVSLALNRTAGNRTRAAELLGITPRTLFRYLDEFGSKIDQTMTEMSGLTDSSVAVSPTKRRSENGARDV